MTLINNMISQVIKFVDDINEQKQEKTTKNSAGDIQSKVGDFYSDLETKEVVLGGVVGDMEYRFVFVQSLLDHDNSYDIVKFVEEFKHYQTFRNIRITLNIHYITLNLITAGCLLGLQKLLLETVSS